MVKNGYKIIPQNHEDSKEFLQSWVNFDVIAYFLYSLVVFSMFYVLSGTERLYYDRSR